MVGAVCALSLSAVAANPVTTHYKETVITLLTVRPSSSLQPEIRSTETVWLPAALGSLALNGRHSGHSFEPHLRAPDTRGQSSEARDINTGSYVVGSSDTKANERLRFCGSPQWADD
jgi:hypothetical protein